MRVRSLRFHSILLSCTLATGLFAQGDNCASAVAVTPGTYAADGPATGAGFDGTCVGAGSATNGDWYVYTPPVNGTVDVYSCLGGADTRLSVFTGICGSLACLGSSDDACPISVGGVPFASQVLGVPAIAGNPIYIQWDDFWTTAGFNWVLNFNCGNAPHCLNTVLLDCANSQFYIDVNIDAMGSATTVDILNNGGAPTIPGATLGNWLAGPFPLGTDVVIQLVNNSDPGCDYFAPQLSNDPCPIISCGPDNYIYCYGNNENTVFVYQGPSSDPLAIYFNSGGMYPFGGDVITIYNGINTGAPILFSGYLADLTGQIWIASNLDNALTMQITTDGFTSCADFGVFPQWDYNVGCLDCTPPQATFAPVMDCANSQWFIEVNITNAGSDPVMEITNDQGVAPTITSGVGTYLAGPFVLNTDVTLVLVNDANPLCNINSGVFTNPTICPVPVPCGFPALNETYCYDDIDSRQWHWVADDGISPLALVFNAGQIGPSFYDNLRIYDGPDNTYPLLYDHTLFTVVDLTGLLAISTGPDIYMEMTANSGFQSCQSFAFTAWDWNVGCLDCMVPAATYTVIPDCIHREFSVEVDVTSTGDATTVDLVNNLNTDTIQNVPIGTYTYGPFDMDLDTALVVTVQNGDNYLCRDISPDLNYDSDSCIIVSCGLDQYSYCYTDDDDAWFVFQSTSGTPIALTFTAGPMLSGDKIIVHNGPDQYSAVIFNGNNAGNLNGLSFNSANADNILGLHILSDELGSCTGGGVPTDMDWFVVCGLASVSENSYPGAFLMYPNPTNGLLTLELSSGTISRLQVQVLDLAGRVVIDRPFAMVPSGPVQIDLNTLANGNYTVMVTTDQWVKAQQVQVAR